MEVCKLCLQKPIHTGLNICTSCKEKVTSSIGRPEMRDVRCNDHGFVCIICLHFGAKPNTTYNKSHCTKCNVMIVPKASIQFQTAKFKTPARKIASPVKTIVKPQVVKSQVAKQIPIIPLVIEHDIYFAAMILAQIRK